MKIYLKKVRTKTLFSMFDPIKVEPLELSYLKTVADEMGHSTSIVDGLFMCSKAYKNDKSIVPDIVVLTGYNVAENEILKEAKFYKSKYPKAKIIVGGVHIQLNSTSFHKSYIDYVIHSQSLDSFRTVLNIIQGEKLDVKGFDYRTKDDNWVIGSKEVISENEEIYPNREFFNAFRNQIYYLDKKEVALIKGGVGCPYKCSYCYCRELNGGKYLKASFKNMVREMSSIDTDYFWIVDDVFFANREDALSFIEEIKKAKLDKKYIAYLRADFIIKEKDIIKSLKEVGLNEVIIGFEAINEEELKSYNKATNAVDYPKVISILKENHLDYTALFMVQPSYGFKDFENLYKFIKKYGIDVFTLSVFTPIKGTKGYDDEKENFVRDDPKYFDFLHLVTKSKLPKIIFYMLFYGMHIRLLKSRRIRNYLLRR